MKKPTLPIVAIALLAGMIVLSALGGGLDIIMSTSPFHNALRALLIGGLIVLAATVRPRHMAVRIGLGLVSIAAVTVTVMQTTAYSLQLLDILMYLGVAIVLMVEAVEDDAVTVEPAKPVAKLGTL